VSRSGGIFDYDQKKERLEEVNRELESPDVWSQPERAQALGKEKVALELVVETIILLELKIKILLMKLSLN
jgi:peptide chain release factor 2